MGFTDITEGLSSNLKSSISNISTTKEVKVNIGKLYTDSNKMIYIWHPSARILNILNQKDIVVIDSNNCNIESNYKNEYILLYNVDSYSRIVSEQFFKTIRKHCTACLVDTVSPHLLSGAGYLFTKNPHTKAILSKDGEDYYMGVRFLVA